MSSLEHELGNHLGMPVIDAVTAAVKIAESLVSLGKTTSKQLTYRPPERKEIQDYPSHYQAENFS